MTAYDEDAVTLGVSLYSYGADFLVTMSLEDCLADVADMGASDVEILADTHVPCYPDPPSAWVDQWHAALERHRLRPTCYSCWLDTRLHYDRGLTLDEARTIFTRDLELAHRLGFGLVRPKLGVVSQSLTPDPIWRPVIESALERADAFGIRIAPEIHAPTPLRSQAVEDCLEFARGPGAGRFGLLIDTGIFQTGPAPTGHSDSVHIFGPVNPDAGAPPRLQLAPLAVDPAELRELMPYVFHVHAKFWEMDDDLRDPQIPYDAVVEALLAGGYRGSLSSEYEGRREPFRASELLRRQQAMLRGLLSARV